ncbi:MAG: ABC transporter permease [Eubacteriales bacterium]|nr:ABC transporter permease [Eubacteriales bacterium]
MRKFLLKRFLILIPVFFGVTFLVFLLSNLAPGSPVDAMITPDMNEAQIQDLTLRMGLDQPIVVQYAKWLGRMVRGDLGYSYRTKTAVTGVIGERIGPTLVLTGTVLILSIAVGVALGVIAAYKPYTFWDYLASGISFVGSGVPSFFLALVLIYFFSVKLRLLPTGGMYTNAATESLADLARHMVLPVIVLTMSISGGYIRQSRSAMLEVLGEEYVKMARARGIKERVVLLRHALRNAMLPIVTAIAMSIPFLVGGSVITEQVFGWPGMGSLMVISISNRDYPVIMGITVYITIAVLAVNVIVDILYALLDPKIRN